MTTYTKIKVGICAMPKKIRSKQMQNILMGLEGFDELQIIIFDENVIFNMNVEVKK